MMSNKLETSFMKDIVSYVKANKARLLPIGLLLFLALATLFTLQLTKKRQELRTKATAATAILSFTPTIIPTSPESTFDVSVNLDSGGQAPVGADILVNFDKNQLTLRNVTRPTLQTNSVFKTYAPVVNDGSGTFDTSRVMSCANTGLNGGSGTDCPSGSGVVEFGIIAFDWANDVLPTPDPANTILSPVITFTFQVAPTASGQTLLTFKYDGTGVTTDSNVVIEPTGTGNPEDILAAPTSVATITLGGAVPTPSPSPSTTPAPTPSASPGVSPSPSATPSTSPGDTGSLTLQVLFEGVGKPGIQPNLTANIELKQGTTIITSQDATFAANGEQVLIQAPNYYLWVYTNTASPLTNLAVGDYDVYVKGPKNLRRLLGSISITANQTTLANFATSDLVLLTGDTNNANKVLLGYTDLVINYGCPNNPVNIDPAACTLVADVDFDGQIDLDDYTYIVSNYNKTGVN
ncbi:MAG: hypothetical protein UV61_C0002G0081 [Candidatus Gottesmanbacteria bacterium GW2011_GWB1_43_11]|uniref:Cohesin domain-containing protein n=1 Tax=Candidatus Gottesmanbacteria bacterium GW2011_GWB1_43_11 TaxID=1618446 RepID=A0A0G1CNL2_9BACT|nr:MAG: hypothetical protein UV04_C0040G0008 [Candidatus Gottesmanbacteria bacterium GW2011_GWA2_42_16]KKS52107.1 MAG: hypothetical protein UV17_C0051G0012 [Candidatus Gottesmanbacteria bacterium GW2011_GWA1_42_26]KKS87360.1 MAG: hypothetical protein UV61_C0002G0081 [Candidatus Gottesmanbacteria bacterium GW2011_GWB1_43_11]